jgi:hypothetical protein
MSSLYPDNIIVERFQASVSAATLAQPFIVPVDLDVVGLVMWLGTAPGATDGLILNLQVTPTSQGLSNYNAYTAANAPTILGTATEFPATSNTTTLVDNFAYALNYPLPGPSGTKGFTTSQATAQTTETPVVSPPTFGVYQLAGLTAPDNTYTDFNSVTQPASVLHAGDVVKFVVTAGGASVSLGSAANLAISLLLQKR